MLTPELITKIAGLIKVKPEDLTNAITATDEVAIELPEVVTFTKPELDTRDKAKSGNGYAEGKRAGVEMAVKDMKEELALDFEGKDLKSLVDNYGKKVLADAKVTPKDTDEIITNLRKTISEQQLKITEVEGKAKAISLNSKVLELIPDNAKGLSKQESEAVLRANGYSWEENESGSVIVKKNGQELLDEKMQTPIEAKDAFKSIFNERGWAAAEGATPAGRGGSSSSPSLKATKLSEVQKEWEASGKSANGQEFTAHVVALQSADPNFNMDA